MTNPVSQLRIFLTAWTVGLLATLPTVQGAETLGTESDVLFGPYGLGVKVLKAKAGPPYAFGFQPGLCPAGQVLKSPISRPDLAMAKAGALWRSRLEVSSMRLPRMRPSPPPPMKDANAYIFRLTEMIRAEKWAEIGREIDRYGCEPKLVTHPETRESGQEVEFGHAFGGILNASANEEVIEKQLRPLKFMGFDCPIVPVKALDARSFRTFDVFFKAVDGKIKPPIIGLCIGSMSVPELLRIPQFLKRYEGQYHSVVVNYDLTNGTFTEYPNSLAVKKAQKRVSLVLTLIRRASPQATTWLAVSYIRSPSWRQWVATQDRETFDGAVLTGESANMACAHPEAARFILKEFRAVMGDKRLALIGFADPFRDPALRRRDDLVLEQYESLRDALKANGLAFLHIQEK